MPKVTPPEPESSDFERLGRSASLTSRVEQLLRDAITTGRFTDGRLPTEVELAEQLGVSRETVRLAADALQREGLLVKIRRRGTFLNAPTLPDQITTPESTTIAYLQAGYQVPQGQTEPATPTINGLMLQGALEEASRHGLRLLVEHAAHTQIGNAFRNLPPRNQLRGVVFAHYGEEKLLRRAAGTGLPIVLLDHDLHLPGVGSVRDDSCEGARQAVAYLAKLGHRRIAFVNWRQTDLNPWRLDGYRRGLRQAGLPRRRVWEVAIELTEAGAKKAVSHLLALTPRPTAVYCFNNTVARLLIENLRLAGLRVPHDISVMGGGGEEVPGLTCHTADWYRIGVTAVQILLREATAKPEHHLAPHRIQDGQTTDAPS
ncbi:MAG: GntR family transcriptional regulator [Planctomycetes bacterium]|nr:GntR family transcriptional regulator [Planctomycetota bacterium]